MIRFCSLILASVAFSSIIVAEDWPHWRGPQRNGITSEHSGFENGQWNITETWRIQLGPGSSSPLIIGDSLISFYFEDGHEVVECRQAASGDVRWKRTYPAPRYGRHATGDQGLYSGPSSTPGYDPKTGLLYTLGSDGQLNCWDLRDSGKPVWQTRLHEEYEIPRRPKVGRSGQRDYGFTSSPLVWEGSLIVEVGARSGTLIAFDKTTGRELWKSDSRSPAGHNGGPVPVQVGGLPCVAVHHHDGLLVARLDRGNEGRTVGQVPWVTSFANNIATAAVEKDRVIVTSAYNQNRIACFQWDLNGPRQIWEQKYPSKICTPIIHQGHVYYCWRTIKCLRLDDGKLVWEGGSTGDAGSMILTGDQRLIVWSNRGKLSLVESAAGSPDRLTVLAEREVLGKTDAWPHVCLAHGYLYCKDQLGNLVCFQVGSNDR